MKIQIIYFYIVGIYELWQGFSFELPVYELQRCIGHDERADEERGQIVLVVGEVNKSERKSDDFENSEVNKVDKVIRGIRLLFVELVSKHPHLKQQYYRVYALPSPALQQVFVPRRNSIAISGYVIGQEPDAGSYEHHAEQ